MTEQPDGPPVLHFEADPDDPIEVQFAKVEQLLLEVCDPKANVPAALATDRDQDPLVLQALVVFLDARGWRIAYDQSGAVFAFAPGPLTPPDPADAALN